MPPPPSGIDETLKLEAVYLSAPIPRNLAVLTAMGAIFDKVYFPGVHLPKEGFDLGELDKEIARLKAGSIAVIISPPFEARARAATPRSISPASRASTGRKLSVFWRSRKSANLDASSGVRGEIPAFHRKRSASDV